MRVTAIFCSLRVISGGWISFVGDLGVICGDSGVIWSSLSVIWGDLGVI